MTLDPKALEAAVTALRLLAAEDARQDKIHELLETIREQIRVSIAPKHRAEGLMKNIQDAVYAMRGRTRLMDDAALVAPLAALPQAEPVAWLRTEQEIHPEIPKRVDTTADRRLAELWRDHPFTESIIPLFASPTPAVSREVTEEMVERAIQAADPDFYAAAKESGPLTYQRAADSMRRALTAALSQPHSEK